MQTFTASQLSQIRVTHDWLETALTAYGACLVENHEWFIGSRLLSAEIDRALANLSESMLPKLESLRRRKDAWDKADANPANGDGMILARKLAALAQELDKAHNEAAATLAGIQPGELFANPVALLAHLARLLNQPTR